VALLGENSRTAQIGSLMRRALIARLAPGYLLYLPVTQRLNQ